MGCALGYLRTGIRTSVLRVLSPLTQSRVTDNEWDSFLRAWDAIIPESCDVGLRRDGAGLKQGRIS